MNSGSGNRVLLYNSAEQLARINKRICIFEATCCRQNCWQFVARLLLDTKGYILPRYRQHVARTSNMLPGNLLLVAGNMLLVRAACVTFSELCKTRRHSSPCRISVNHNPNPNLHLWHFNPKTIPFLGYPKIIHSLYQVSTLWDHSFLSYAPDKQWQTKKQTDSNMLPTPTDRVIILTRLLLTSGRSLSESRSRERACSCRLSSDDVIAADCRSCWLQRLHSHNSFRHRSVSSSHSITLLSLSTVYTKSGGKFVNI